MDGDKRKQDEPAEGELEARELEEEELDDVSGGDPGYFHPAPYNGPIGGH